MAYKKKAKKTRRHVDSAIVHVKSSFNNTLGTVTTLDGDVLLRNSSGQLGYKGSRKGTPFAATKVGEALAKEMVLLGIKNLEFNLQGPGSGRDSLVRAMQAAGFNLTVLRDVTPLPHNGTKAPKKRRV